MKKTVIAAILTVGILTLAACSGDGDGDSKVVAETGAGDISKEDFYNEMKSQSGKQVLRKMVTLKILNDKYDVSDEQVDKEVQKTKDQLGKQFEMFLKQQGIKNEEAYRETIRLSMLQMEAAAEDMDITKEDLKQRHDRMQTEIHAKDILVQDKETAKEVKSKLEDGGDFAELAKEYSKDNKTAKKGGDLGFISAGQKSQKFDDKIYSMEPGTVSDPVKMNQGVHIIKVVEKRDTKQDIGKFEDSKDMVRRSIISQQIDRRTLQQKIAKLIQDSDISVDAEGLEDMFKQKKPDQGSEDSDKKSDGDSEKSGDDQKDSSEDSN